MLHHIRVTFAAAGDHIRFHSNAPLLNCDEKCTEIHSMVDYLLSILVTLYIAYWGDNNTNLLHGNNKSCMYV